MLHVPVVPGYRICWQRLSQKFCYLHFGFLKIVLFKWNFVVFIVSYSPKLLKYGSFAVLLSSNKFFLWQTCLFPLLNIQNLHFFYKPLQTNPTWVSDFYHLFSVYLPKYRILKINFLWVCMSWIYSGINYKP